MKTASDPRHLQREKAVKKLFSHSFKKTTGGRRPADPVFLNLKKIDNVIRRAAPEWPIEQINRLDLAVLRLAVYELVIAPREPPRVVIDEAVELAKKFGSEKSPGFVNGVLGTVFQEKEGGQKKQG